MNDSKLVDEPTTLRVMDGCMPNKGVHPAWHTFIRYCTELQHGEIELLKIQDGLPVLAEVVKKKVKFSR